LDGEAFFAVARDSARPFAVRTRAGSVEVLGTRFDLHVVGDELRLVVTEGRVALVSGVHRRVVLAGQIARVRDGGPPEVEEAVEIDSLLAWTQGFIVFQNTPLHQVAREIERRYDVRVLLPDSTIASRTVTAWFTNQDFEQVFSAICRAVDAHCTLHDNVASIEP
jgi:transmembrane sensor